jgi:hypothetical protein
VGKPAWISELVSRLLPEARPQGRRSRRDGASEGRIFTTKARRSALRLPSKRGEKTKSLNSRGGARTRSRGCLKFESKFEARRLLTSPRSFAGRGRREAPGEGPGTALTNRKLLRSKGLQRNKHDPRVRRAYLPQCLAPHPKPSLRYGFDLSPRKSGARLRATSP